MNAKSTIIDVTPVSFSSSRAAEKKDAASNATSTVWEQDAKRAASSPHYSSAWKPYTNTASYTTREYKIPVAETQQNAPLNALGGLVQMAVGTGMFMLGLPMLILPGPGLLFMLGGAALASSGARKLFPMRAHA